MWPPWVCSCCDLLSDLIEQVEWYDLQRPTCQETFLSTLLLWHVSPVAYFWTEINFSCDLFEYVGAVTCLSREEQLLMWHTWVHWCCDLLEQRSTCVVTYCSVLVLWTFSLVTYLNRVQLVTRVHWCCDLFEQRLTCIVTYCSVLVLWPVSLVTYWNRVQLVTWLTWAHCDCKPQVQKAAAAAEPGWEKHSCRPLGDAAAALWSALC